MKILPITLLLSFLAGSCAMPTLRALPAEPETPVPTVTPKPAGWESRPINKPQLYARDGSIVGSQEPGTVATSPNTGQTSSEGGGSRWTLLEQYQAAVQAREELEIEVQGLSAALDQTEEREMLLVTELEQLRAVMGQYEGRIEKLEGENVDLAARLTTAQIRRLQAEKLLLEAKLDWKRIQTAMSQSTGSEATNDSGAIAQPVEPGKTSTPSRQTP